MVEHEGSIGYIKTVIVKGNYFPIIQDKGQGSRIDIDNIHPKDVNIQRSVQGLGDQ
jgi:hypothetical protein